MEDSYIKCLQFNREEKSEIDRLNSNVINPMNLVLHPMMRYYPMCYLDCPYAKKCAELWGRK